MIRSAPALGLVLAGCVCQPPEPCMKITNDVDGGVHWFRLPVHPSAGADELTNLDNRDGLLFPSAPGPVSFSLDGECQRQRWTGMATDDPFVFSSASLTFPLTRPGTTGAPLPLTSTNLTDDPITVELRVPLGFSADSISLVQLAARGSQEFFLYFVPPSIGAFDDDLDGVAFSEATHTVSLHGSGGGPVVAIPSRFDAGTVAAMGPQQRPDGRWVPIRNDAVAGEPFSDLVLPPTGTADCPGLQVVVEEPRVVRGNSSTRILILIPTDRIGEFACNVTLASSPKPVSFQAVWRTTNLPPCDIADWPQSAIVSDAGFATVELVTGREGCLLTFPRLEPADAGKVLVGWGELEVPPQSVVPIDVIVHERADLVVNVSDQVIRSLGVSVLP